ncbi:Festuclavine synthase II [Bienertia sinuspersici]
MTQILESESESGSSDDESSWKNAKILDPISDEAHLEATEEAALKEIIWDSCLFILELCKKLSDQLYHSVLDGAAILVYLLFDKDDLYRMHNCRIIYGQQSKFWDELEQEFDPFLKMEKPVYEACKWIVHKKVDQDRYYLLNEYDLATLLLRYEKNPDMKPYGDSCYDYDKEFVESAIGDDIQEAIRKAKLCRRLTLICIGKIIYMDALVISSFLLVHLVESVYKFNIVDHEMKFKVVNNVVIFFLEQVDEYTSLLIGMVRNESHERQDSPFAEALKKIDTETLYGLDDSLIKGFYDLPIDPDCSVHEELYHRIEVHLIRILIHKTSMVQNDARFSVVPFYLLFNIPFLKGPSSKGEFDPSKAEGSRFIKRDHFLRAFDELGSGLRTAFKDEIASRMVAENHPPYHIYETAFVLAHAEQEVLQAEHLAFAVIFGNFFAFRRRQVKEMQADFHSFKTALHMRCVSLPKESLKKDSWDDFSDNFYDSLCVYLQFTLLLHLAVIMSRHGTRMLNVGEDCIVISMLGSPPNTLTIKKSPNGALKVQS